MIFCGEFSDKRTDEHIKNLLFFCLKKLRVLCVLCGECPFPISQRAILVFFTFPAGRDRSPCRHLSPVVPSFRPLPRLGAPHGVLRRAGRCFVRDVLSAIRAGSCQRVVLLKAVSVCSAFRCFQAVQHSVQRLPGGRAATDEVAEVTFGVGYGEEGLLFAIRHDMLLEECPDVWQQLHEAEAHALVHGLHLQPRLFAESTLHVCFPSLRRGLSGWFRYWDGRRLGGSPDYLFFFFFF